MISVRKYLQCAIDVNCIKRDLQRIEFVFVTTVLKNIQGRKLPIIQNTVHTINLDGQWSKDTVKQLSPYTISGNFIFHSRLHLKISRILCSYSSNFVEIVICFLTWLVMVVPFSENDAKRISHRIKCSLVSIPETNSILYATFFGSWVKRLLFVCLSLCWNNMYCFSRHSVYVVGRI